MENNDEFPTWTPEELDALRQLWDDWNSMYDVIDEPEPFIPEPSLPETAITSIPEFVIDAVQHPATTTAEALMWLPQMNVGKWGLKGLAGQLGLDFGGAIDMLRKGDEQASRFISNMVKHPGDWYHLIKGATGAADNTDAETLHKTFDYERP